MSKYSFYIKKIMFFCFFKKTGIFGRLNTNLKLFRMKKLLLLIVLFVFVGGYTLLAQTKVITGTVTSSVEGEGPIPGVTVVVKGYHNWYNYRCKREIHPYCTSKCYDSYFLLYRDEKSGGCNRRPV